MKGKTSFLHQSGRLAISEIAKRSYARQSKHCNNIRRILSGIWTLYGSTTGERVSGNDSVMTFDAMHKVTLCLHLYGYSVALTKRTNKL